MVSRSNFLELFESRWLEAWRSLASGLAESHPIEWDVWSHPFGPGRHTAGIELRGTAHGYAERVFCLVDLANCEAEPTIETAELSWEWEWEPDGRIHDGSREVFSEAVPLNPQTWRKLEDTFEEWALLLETLLTAIHPQLSPCACGFRSVAHDLESPQALGTEPDFSVWSAYLEKQPDTLLVVPWADGRECEEQAADLECVKRALLKLEPSLGKDTVGDWMAQPPLPLREFLTTSRPIQFAEPLRGRSGYHGTMRQLLGQYPDATGVLYLSRVAFGKGQALFMAGVKEPTDLNPSPVFAFGQESPDGWRFRHLTIDLEAIDMEDVWPEQEPEEMPPLPSLEVTVPGIKGACFLDSPRRGKERLQVEFEDGKVQIFNVLREPHVREASLLEPPYIGFSERFHHTPTSILEACAKWASSQND